MPVNLQIVPSDWTPRKRPPETGKVFCLRREKTASRLSVTSLLAAKSLSEPVRPNYPFFASVVSALSDTMPAYRAAVDRVISEVPANRFVGLR